MQKFYLHMLALLVSFGVATAGGMSHAHASATACTKGVREQDCVQVVGAGLFVQSVTPGIKLLPRVSLKGHFEVWTLDAGTAGFHYNTPETVLWNQSWVTFLVQWGPTRNISKYLPNNSLVCARFWTFTSGAWRGHGDICVRVHS
jgi:hypothetical protein